MISNPGSSVATAWLETTKPRNLVGDGMWLMALVDLAYGISWLRADQVTEPVLMQTQGLLAMTTTHNNSVILSNICSYPLIPPNVLDPEM